MSNDAWSMRKEVWKKEITDESNRLTMNNSNERQGEQRIHGASLEIALLIALVLPVCV